MSSSAPATFGDRSNRGEHETDELGLDSRGVDVPSSRDNTRSFGRLHLLRELGRGGMGVVYLAYDPELNRKVALKVLRDDRASGEKSRVAQTRLLQEAQALAKLADPNVVPIFDVGRHGEQVFLTMEFVEGQSLREWLQRPGRRMDDILHVMLQAGRGLAAAHRAGIVHRDFKPDNVIIDHKGRVQVLDFGLVQTMASEPTIPSDRQYAHLHSASTGSDCVFGTPGYMAVEQMLGQTCSAATDQFAYCVTLYEALCGCKPFAVHTVSSQLEEYRTKEPKHYGHLPARLHQLIIRGLSADMADRHVSMDDLLDAIVEHQRRLRRRRWWLRTGTSWGLGIFVGAIALTALANTEGSDPCPSMAERWDGVWDDERKRAIHRSFAATGVAWAEGTWDRLEHQLDGHVAQWLQLRHDVCRETKIDNLASGADMDIRMRCLKLDLKRMTVLSDEFVTANGGLVARAVQAVEAMPKVDQCRDAESLRRDVPWPDDVETLRKVESFRTQLAEVTVQRETGRWTQARDRGELLVAWAVDGLTFKAARAELRAELAVVYTSLGNTDRAIEHSQAAALLAQASGHHQLAATTAVHRIYLRGYMGGDIEGAQSLVGAAQARLVAAGRPPEIEGLLLGQRAILRGVSGKVAESEVLFRRSLAKIRRAYGENHPEVSMALTNLALTLALQRRPVEAIKLYTEAITINEWALGRKHPGLSIALSNLARLYLQLGRPQVALSPAQRALDICASTRAPNTLTCSNAQAALAGSHTALGNFAAALEILGTLRDAQELAGRRGDPIVRWAEFDIAELWLRRGEFDRAEEMARTRLDQKLLAPSGATGHRIRDLRTIAQVELAHGRATAALDVLEPLVVAPRDEGPIVALERRQVHGLIGDALLLLGNIQDALRHHEIALGLAIAAFGVDNPVLTDAHRGFAQSLAAAGHNDAALAEIQHAIELRVRSVGPDNHTLSTHFAQLASIQLELQDAESAVANYEHALELWDPAQVPEYLRAPLHFGLAQALVESMECSELGEPLERAGQLAELARVEYLAWGGAGRAALAKVERWIDQGRPRM